MKKLTLLMMPLLFSSFVFSQYAVLIFKKKNKTLSSFWVGSTIAFQLKDKQWQKGEVTSIKTDSFYIRPSVIRYTLYNTDTSYYNVLGFALHDVYAMPKKGVLIDYKDGQYQISTSGGHQHWYWIKSGWLFRVAGAGYAGLIVANTLIDNDLSLSDSKPQLAVSAAVFVAGVILKKIYKLTLRVRKKYRLEVFELRN